MDIPSQDQFIDKIKEYFQWRVSRLDSSIPAQKVEIDELQNIYNDLFKGQCHGLSALWSYCMLQTLFNPDRDAQAHDLAWWTSSYEKILGLKFTYDTELTIGENALLETFLSLVRMFQGDAQQQLDLESMTQQKVVADMLEDTRGRVTTDSFLYATVVDDLDDFERVIDTLVSPGKLVILGNGGHATGISCDSEGNLYYYNSNHDYSSATTPSTEMFLTSVEEIFNDQVRMAKGVGQVFVRLEVHTVSDLSPANEDILDQGSLHALDYTNPHQVQEENFDKLIRFALQQPLETAKYYVEKYAEIAKDADPTHSKLRQLSSGIDIFSLAILIKRADVIEWLIQEKGYDPLEYVDQHGNTPLNRIIVSWFKPDIQRDRQAVEHLVSLSPTLVMQANNDLDTPLHFAVLAQDKETVRFFISSFPDALQAANNDDYTPVGYAADLDNTEILSLIEELAPERLLDKNGQSQTLLHISAQNGRLACANFLFQRIPALNTRDDEGRLPMHYAAINGHTDVVKFFLQQTPRGDNLYDEIGHTPIHYASLYGHVEMVEMMLTKEPDMITMPTNPDGNTVFHLALLAGKTDMLQCLFARNPDAIQIPNQQGLTPLALARSMGNDELVNSVEKLIIQHQVQQLLADSSSAFSSLERYAGKRTFSRLFGSSDYKFFERIINMETSDDVQNILHDLHHLSDIRGAERLQAFTKLPELVQELNKVNELCRSDSSPRAEAAQGR